MTRHWILTLSLVVSTALAATPALALDAQKPAPKTQTQAGSSTAVEPSAIHAIGLMAEKLRSLKMFTLNVDATSEDVLDSGQKVTYGGTVVYKIRAPDKLFASINSDRRQRSVYYDGSKLTIYAPRMHYYAQKEKTGTVHDLVEAAQEKYDIEMPLADLFYWGTDKAPLSLIQSATVIGPAHVDKVECDHLLMRQSGVDWQVWIARDTLLPQKLVIANLDDPTQPEYTATLTWDTSSPLPDSVFSFTPTPDDHLIKINENAAATKEASP